MKKQMAILLLVAGGAIGSASMTSVAGDLDHQARQLVETIDVADWPEVRIWVLEAATAGGRSLQIVNGSKQRVSLFDAQGRVIRILKPGVTTEVSLGECDVAGVLGVAPGPATSATLVECRAGRLYQIRERGSNALMKGVTR